ncbi:MAG: pyridoxal phosphate-dependent aminotransferase [bacterium]|jgi:aminotransferase
MIQQAKRMNGIPFSGIRRIMEMATRLEANGKHIIHMEMGRPDFDTPNNVKEMAKRALDESRVFYTSNYGTIDLRRAISEKLIRDNHLQYDPEKEIIVTAGVSEGVFDSLFTFLDDGDEILIPNPTWLNYLLVTRMVGAVPVSYHILRGNRFQIDIEEIESRITNRTKALVVMSPNNPTGGVLEGSVLERLAEIACEHDLIVISDEIYEKIIFDGYQHISIAEYPGMKERTIVLNGFSKAYSMTGWRLGYMAASEQMIRELIKTHQYNATSASSISQYAGIEALSKTKEAVDHMVLEYRRRRDYIVKALGATGKIGVVNPQGAFYLFADISGLGMSSEEAAMFLLNKCGVAAVPGTTFGDCGEGYIRFSYATDYANIVEACRRISKGISGLTS